MTYIVRWLWAHRHARLAYFSSSKEYNGILKTLWSPPSLTPFNPSPPLGCQSQLWLLYQISFHCPLMIPHNAVLSSSRLLALGFRLKFAGVIFLFRIFVYLSLLPMASITLVSILYSAFVSILCRPLRNKNFKVISNVVFLRYLRFGIFERTGKILPDSGTYWWRRISV